MINREITKIFFEMAELLEMKDVQFKPRAYERAAHSIESLEDDLKEIYEKGGMEALEDIPNVGEGIAKRIEEYIKTGEIKDYRELKKEIPIDISALTAIEGVGPKTAKTLYEHLKITNLDELESAAKQGKVRDLPGMGEKTEQKILNGIQFLRHSHGRISIGEALPIARSIVKGLRGLDSVKAAEMVGSLRRWRETIGDLDFLAIADDSEEVMDYFVSMPEVIHTYSKGTTKTMVRLKGDIDADLRVLPEESFGAALQYFTGSKEHNVELRKIAIKKGYKLNEYGLFKGEKLVAGKNEQVIYNKLGLDWMPPEIRTNSGEIEVARKHDLPKLVELSDLRGDLQMHTTWSDGGNSIEEMAKEAVKIGHEYILITDHTKSLAMTGGADEQKLRRQMKEIDKVNKNISGITVLKGAEVNILKDGTLDIDDEVLSELDIVGAAIHSHFNFSENEQTERLIRAMENPHIDIILHPTSRIILKREGIKLDLNRLFNIAKQTGTVLEINAHPWRLDLNGDLVRKAKEYGIRFSIGTDAHTVSELHYLEYGVGQARRGWLEKKDIINTLPLKNLTPS